MRDCLSDVMAGDTVNEPTLLLDLLRTLTTPSTDGPKHDSGSSQDSLGQMLEFQLQSTHDLKTKDVRYHVLDVRVEEFLSGSGDIHWRFVGLLLRILLLYKTKVTESMPQYEEEVKRLEKIKRTDDTAPPMSPDTLGSSQTTTVVSSLQFIACLGICPALLPGVGVPVYKRSQMMSKITQPQASLSREVRDRRLTHCVAVLLECAKLPSLRSLILTHHCGDLLAMLVQLSYAPLPRPKEAKIPSAPQVESGGKKDNQAAVGDNQTTCDGAKDTQAAKTNESQGVGDSYLSWQAESDHPLTLSDRRWAREQLLLFTRGIPVQPLIRELLILQGAPPASPGGATQKTALMPSPPWLRKYCGFLLSECLMRPQGVKNVLRALLEDTAGFEIGNKSSSVDWKKCEAVARVIASCPQQVGSPESYYAAVGPQVLELLHLKNEVVAKQIVRVAGTAIAAMMELQPQIAMGTMMKPLMKPLLAITTVSDIEKIKQTDIIVDEDSITKCIEDVHKVFVTGMEPHSSLLSSLLLILHPLFRLYVFASSGVFSIRSLCHDILTVYLKQSSVADSLSCLHHFIFTRRKDDDDVPDVGTLHPQISFAAGPTGGVEAVLKKDRNEDLEQEIQSVSKSISQLLLKLNRPELTAELFLFLLKKLSGIIREEVDPHESPSSEKHESASGSEFLEVTTGLENIRDNLTVLSLLENMTEQLGPDCFTQTQHIVDFVQVTLERGVTVLKNTEDEMFGAFENETVTMAMGMLTAVMGGAKKLNAEEKTHLKVLLPLLQELSEQHPDPGIQEMASDLRIAIATHGFILSDGLQKSNIKKAAEASHGAESANEKVRNDNPSEKTKKKPLIEVISSTENNELEKRADSKTAHSVKGSSQDNEVKEGSSAQGKVKKEDLKMGSSSASFEEPSQSEGEMSEYKEAIGCLLDPLLPVRGHGLIMLSKLLQNRDAESLRNADMLLKVFQENIHHEDSYIYLAAINGLAALAVHSPDKVLPVLAKCYCQKIKDEKGGNDASKKKERNVEWRLKLGETLVKTCKALGEFVPAYRDMLVSSCLTVAKDEDQLVRASAISNLGDICRLLRFSLGNIVFQVLDCVSALLRSDPDAEVRKSAAMFTTLLLQGLGRDAFKVLEEALRDLYRLLKMTLSSEKEEMVRVHVQLSLDELDSIMRKFLFPKQTLTKHIYVADAPPN